MLSQLRLEGQNDPEIYNLIDAITNNNWHMYPQLSTYRKIASELTHKGGLILKGTQLLVPKRLRGAVLSIVHANHLGINKTKSLLRSKVWWPTICTDTEKMIRRVILTKTGQNSFFAIKSKRKIVESPFFKWM